MIAGSDTLLAVTQPQSWNRIKAARIVMDRSDIIASLVPYAALQPDARTPNHECDRLPSVLMEKTS